MPSPKKAGFRVLEGDVGAVGVQPHLVKAAEWRVSQGKRRIKGAEAG